MTRLIGVSTVTAAFVLAIAGSLAAIVGARRGSERLTSIGRSTAYIIFLFMFIANAAMIYALVTHDFSISDVAQVGSRSTPLLFRIISLWSSLEGSI
ncbi:MAG TPA: hypothetical protein VGD49_02160, partial [Longimicrobiales bacterium]